MIVGIAGPARAGKDTAAQALVRDLGFRRVGFADKLKKLAIEANPLVTSNVQTVNIGTGAGHLAHVVQGNGSWEQAKDFYPLVREFLQNLGVGCRTVFGVDFWIDRLFDQVADGELVVISDVRFENEVKAIIDRGGKVIRLDRIGFRGQVHVSETEIATLPDEMFSAVISNDGDVVTLERDVVTTVKGFLEPPKKKTASKKTATKKKTAAAEGADDGDR